MNDTTSVLWKLKQEHNVNNTLMSAILRMLNEFGLDDVPESNYVLQEAGKVQAIYL